MLRISKLTDYATIVMGHLASDQQQVKSAAQIARSVHISTPTVSKLLKILAEANLLLSFRGTGGGYKLARDAKEILLSEILMAIEGDIAMTECANHAGHCTLDSLCALKENWRYINKIILATLSDITLHDMVRPLNKNTANLRGVPIRIQD